MAVECIFCKIVSGEALATRVFEADRFIVIPDIAPKAPVHLLFISKKHISSLQAIELDDRQTVSDMLGAVPRIAADRGVDVSGYKVITNVGEDGGQLVPHLHFHFLAGKKIDELV